MKWIKYTSRQETYANILLWSVMLIVPVVGMVVLSSVDNNYDFRWIDIWHVMRPMLVVLLAFLVHNYFIAPEIVYKNRKRRYYVLLVVLLMAFVAYQCTSGPPAKPTMVSRQVEQDAGSRHGLDGQKPLPNPNTPPRHYDRGRGGHHRGPKPLAGPHDFTMFSLLIFALGANLGLKLYFKTMREKQQVVELEKENLRQELTYLRYQVNPHFLMNTLNNIHALVDIDPEQAKSSIVHLSKFMRYLLYESDQELITLRQVVDLVSLYIDLMSKRYAESVDIRFDAPEQVPNVGMAPLVIIPFIENAFKHGVSYDKPSFIHMSLRVVDSSICFVCVNSKNHIKHEVGGVGLANVVKRLDLIYGDQYSLHVDDGDNYRVELIVPADSLGTQTMKNLANNY